MHADPHGTATHDRFLRQLSASMHEMAQPMATIQASLELALLSPTTETQYREIAENILGQLRSAAESMQFAARLARFQQPATDVRDVLLSVVLEEVISSLQRTLETSQLQLLFFRSEHEPVLSASPARLRQMLFYILQALQAHSQPGDLAKIEIQEPAGHLVLRIKHSAAKNRETRTRPSLDNMVERALALADAIVTNAGGELSVSTDPLLIVADFPVKLASGTLDTSKVPGLSTSQMAVVSPRLVKTS